jgi:hypothetical protein
MKRRDVRLFVDSITFLYKPNKGGTSMKRLCLMIVPLILFATSLSCLAQTVTGSVRGTITDPSGAIIAGATVTVKNTATGDNTKAITNGAGEYSVRFLQIGQYKLSVEAAGFAQEVYGPFALEIDQDAKVDLKLKVGGANTSVEVSDQFQPILDTENATLGETFTENTIHNIPLSGLDFSQLAVYTPGAVSTGFGNYGNSNSTERSTGADNEVSVNGSRQQSNNYLLDGQEINENINNTLGYNPSPEALDQVRVIASNPNAEFGNVNGGTVIAAMKSGTNSWHGSVFGYLKNYNLDANSWANDNNIVPVAKNPYTAAQFGGTFGGPIFHDKLFFFMDYLGFRTHVGGETNASVATTAYRTGDLSALLHNPNPNNNIQLYDTTTLDENGRPTPYANNQIPVNNPVAAYLFSNAAAYPLPNNPTTDPAGIYNNFVGPSGSFATNDQGDVKIDWHYGTRDVMAFRYSQGYAGDGTTADPLPVQFPSASNYPDHLFAASWVHTFSPAIVNIFNANYGRIRFNSGVTTDPSGIFGLNGNTLVGIPSTAQLTAGFSSQSMDNSGNGEISNVGANPTPEIFIDNIFGYADSLTWQRGKHLFKFGGNFLRYQQNSFYPGNDGELGFFDYSGVYSSNGNTPVSTADFILDRSRDVGVGAVTGRTGQRQWRDGIYAQDDWKILPNLTINLGLRWEFDQPIFEVNNKEANLNLTTGAIEYAGVDGASRALYDADYAQFQPRVGFAWQMMPRLVIRGGYGISSYLEGTGANLRLTQNPPFHKDFEEVGTSPTTTDGVYSPGIFYQAANGFPTTAVPTTTFYAWPKNLKPSVTQEFSLTTEYQVARNSTFQAGYVGIIGRHLTDPFWGNQSTAAGLPGPYDNVVGTAGIVKITQTSSNSSYNALQAVFRQRLTAGFELTANYTYSKSLTDDIGFYGVTNIGSGQYYQQNAYDMKSEWGPAGMDTRHNISVTGVYDLPFGHGRMFGSNMNRILDEAVGGWRLGGADVYYSGFPVTVSSNAYYSSVVHAFTGAARPNLLRHFVSPNKSINAYWGTAVQDDYCASDTDDGTCIFQEQSGSAFGALRPGFLRGPSFQNIDMSVSKTFQVWHEQHLEFRANFFNAFNIADYNPPSANVSDGSNFGKITGTINNNRSTQLSLKYVF